MYKLNRMFEIDTCNKFYIKTIILDLLTFLIYRAFFSNSIDQFFISYYFFWRILWNIF